MQKTLGVKSILKLLLRVGLVCVVVMFGFIAWIIIELPKDRLQKIPYDQKLRPSAIGPKAELQSGVLIGEDLLVDYLLWSEDGNRVKWWFDHKLDDGGMLDLGEKVELKKNYNLPYLLTNDCPDLYCLQHRIPFEKIPSLIWKGLIGIEDYRFLDHPGVDIKSIMRAIVHDLKTMRFEQGGSTLTQQLVKNLFYSSEKKLQRKLKEMVASVYLETKLDKELILEAYLNEVEWGALQGIKIKGIYSAALFYFKKSPSELTSFESSILISLLKGPNFYSPIYHLKRLKDRTGIVFAKLVQLGLLSSVQNKGWSEEQWKNWRESILKRHKERNYYSLWKVMKESESDLNQYEIFVFIKTAESLVRDLRKKYPKQSFAIKAILGRPNTHRIFRYYSKYERREVIAITEEYHQVGSILKPILYGVYSESGLDLDDVVLTAPFVLDLKSGKWSPKESHGNLPEEITYKEALQMSLNRPIIRYAMEMSFEKLQESLKTIIPRLKMPLSEYPAQLLGAVELSMEEIYRLYERFITKECNGNPLILDSLADPKKTTIRRRVGEIMGDMKFFGKTGTTNKGVDNWFVSFDGMFLGIIWVGIDGKRPEESLQLYGSNTAFKVFVDYSKGRGKRFPEMSCDFVASVKK